MIAALQDGIAIWDELVKEPYTEDPTIDSRLADVGAAIGAAATEIRAFLGLPPPSAAPPESAPPASCVSQAAYDILRRVFNPGDPLYDVADWSSADKQAVLDGLSTWGSTSFEQDWKRQFATSIVAGNDQAAMQLVLQQLSQEVVFEACSSTSPVGPSLSPGAATITITGGQTLTADLEYIGERFGGTGSDYPALYWASPDQNDFLKIITLERGAVGDLSTDAGTLGVEGSIGIDYGVSIGLGHEGLPNAGCDASLRQDAGGIISGSVVCHDIYGLVSNGEEFIAEFSTGPT
jgi:hypothetical protein